MASIIIEVDPVTTRLARHIDVQRHGSDFSLVIDGSEFPWAISEQHGISIDVSDDLPTVTLTIMAQRVTVDQTLDPIN